MTTFKLNLDKQSVKAVTNMLDILALGCSQARPQTTAENAQLLTGSIERIEKLRDKLSDAGDCSITLQELSLIEGAIGITQKAFDRVVSTSNDPTVLIAAYLCNEGVKHFLANVVEAQILPQLLDAIETN